jgi:hypothetical protein
MKRTARAVIAGLGGAMVLGLVATPALAAPTNAKNAFSGMAVCDNGGSYNLVVNNANGQGQGAQTNGQSQAEWAPAHLSSGEVFHPTVFDLTYTFTPPSGPSESFLNNDARPNKSGDVTCTVSGSQSDPQGGTFSLSGSVTGFIS